MDIIGLLAALSGGAVGGAALIGFVVRSRYRERLSHRSSSFESEITLVRERLQVRESLQIQLEREAAEQKTSLKEYETEVKELSNDNVELRTKLAGLEDMEEKLKHTFNSISADALSRNNKTFLDLAESTFGKIQTAAEANIIKKEQGFTELVGPIKESLSKVDEKIGKIEKERTSAYEGLIHQIRTMSDSQTTLRNETANLVKALRAPNTRGRWGEIQLKRVVEMAGMLEHCDFFEQKTFDGDAAKVRPDVIIQLPANKIIVVDSKVPLTAYLESIESTDDVVKKECLLHHASQVRRHIQQLSQKAYWDQFKNTPEFVVLFLPGEPFFSAALEADPSLIEYGVEQKVILATPTTLISMLRAVSHGWRQENLNDNAREVCELGKALYSRISDMNSHFLELGTKLRASVKTYNKAVGSFENRVLVSARKFKNLEVGHRDKEIAKNEMIDEIPRELNVPEMIKGATNAEEL